MTRDRSRPPYKISAAYHAQLAMNARWAEADGWRTPETFGDAREEVERIRRGAGLQDVSALGKLDVKGTAVDRRVGECDWLDGVRAVLRLKPGHALVLTAPGREKGVYDAVAAVFNGSAGCVHITDITSGLTALTLVGPHAADVLAGLTSIDLRSGKFEDKSSAQCSVAHVHATIYRGDWGDLRAYLLLVGRDVGEYLWTTLRHAGEPVGLTPFGIAAEGLLRDAHVAGAPRAAVVAANRPVVSPS